MSKVCQVCDKRKATGNNVSHSNRRTRRVFKPNLQVVTVNIGGVSKKLKVCSKCIKTLGKNRQENLTRIKFANSSKMFFGT